MNPEYFGTPAHAVIQEIYIYIYKYQIKWNINSHGTKDHNCTHNGTVRQLATDLVIGAKDI